MNRAVINTGIVDSDEGIVIFSTNLRLYYTGLGWDKQLRNAKIYHSEKYAEKIVTNNTDKYCIFRKVRIAII